MSPALLRLIICSWFGLAAPFAGANDGTTNAALAAAKTVYDTFRLKSDAEGENQLFKQITYYSDPATAAWYIERAGSLIAAAFYAKSQEDMETAAKAAKRAAMQLDIAEKKAKGDTLTLASIEEIRGDLALYFSGDSDEAKGHYKKSKDMLPENKAMNSKMEALK